MDQNTNPFVEQKEQEVDLREYIRIIRRHLRIIVLIFIVVLGTTIYYTAKAPRIYESSGKVLLEMNKQTSSIFLPTAGFGRNDLNNQMQVIVSRPIIARAIEKLKRNPQAATFPLLSAENPITALTGALDISAEREVDIFSVSYKSTNPLEAEKTVNSVISSYQEENLKHSRAELTNVREFLAEQLDRTSKKLAVSEEDLREYKVRHKTFALSEETKEMITNMGEFEGEFQAALTELQVAKKRLSFSKSQLLKLTRLSEKKLYQFPHLYLSN